MYVWSNSPKYRCQTCGNKIPVEDLEAVYRSQLQAFLVSPEEIDAHAEAAREMMGEKDMLKYWLPWLVGMPAEQSRAACCLILGGVLERLPDLRVCLAHGGGSFPYTIGRIEHGFRMRPDLVATDNARSPREYFDRLFFDSCVHDPQALRYLVDVAGIDRVMLGTDYPFPLGEQEPGSGIAALKLDDTSAARIYHGTALQWLGLPAARFS